MGDGITRSATFSPCRNWRYTLDREWEKDYPRCLFVLLNPSTADEKEDDPTNVRGIGFAKAWNCGSVTFVNLFAWRTPYPKELKAAADPVGPDNDATILREAQAASSSRGATTAPTRTATARSSCCCGSSSSTAWAGRSAVTPGTHSTCAPIPNWRSGRDQLRQGNEDQRAKLPLRDHADA